jgi:hypothetical protein
MKLSQKLLGLAGLAMADYACCPYDDYGMPHADCVGVLTEKTPFGTADQTFQQNECKAWETNVDATYEGNSRSSGCATYNWGSCGFQRHFPWRTWDATEREKLSLGAGTTGDEFRISFDVTSAPSVAAYATASFTTTETLYNVGALPFLGGMCKLFIPAPSAKIVQVQVAGVHKAAGIAQYPASAVVQGSGAALAGTVYCFGVANIAETADNTNFINNGNVAGDGRASGTPNGRTDPFASLNSLDRQAGVAYSLDFGSELLPQTGTETDSTEQHIAEGANFDVVAHFADDWCETMSGNVAEMQLAGDENNGDLDYPINQASGFSHAHNDVLDKRHNTPGYGSYYVASSIGSGYLATSTTTATLALKWPNAGAWAAYYSNIICAKTSATFAGTDPAKTLYDGVARDGVLSVSANDYRRNDDGQTTCTTDTVSHRFNLRQMGTDIEVCGPGTLPDVGTSRCTWNWNYKAGSYGATNAGDPEGFFDRSDQLTVDTWSRKRRGVELRSGQLGGSSALANDAVTMVVQFKNNAGALITPSSVTADGARVTGQVATTTASIAVACQAGTVPTGGNQRDAFPDCFQGDEVHFEMTYVPCSDPATCSYTTLLNNWFSTVTGFGHP